MSGPMMSRLCIAMQILCAAILLSVARVSCSAAQDIGNPDNGHTIAKAVCAACHAVEPAQDKSPNGLAPSFATIANTPGMTALALRVALRSPHPVMPNLKTTEHELEDIVAYVQTLKKKKP